MVDFLKMTSRIPIQTRYKYIPTVRIPKTTSKFSEYKKSLESRRAQVEEAQRKTEAYKVKVPRTQRQLRVRRAPLTQMIRVKRERAARGKAKAQALGRIRTEFGKQEKLEREFAPKYKSYQEYQVKVKKMEAWNRAARMYERGVPHFYVGGQTGYYLKKLAKTRGGWRPSFK